MIFSLVVWAQLLLV